MGIQPVSYAAAGTCHAATAFTSAVRTRASSSANASALAAPAEPSTPTTMVPIAPP